MKLPLVLAILAAGVGSPAFAVAPSDSLRVKNLMDFDFVVKTVTENDAGFPTRVTGANRDSLTRLTFRLRAQAATADEVELGGLMNQWLRFIRHGHLWAGRIADRLDLPLVCLPETGMSDSTLHARARATVRSSTPATSTTFAVSDSVLAALGPRLEWTEAFARKKLSKLGKRRDPIEGIWDGGLYRMAVLRTDKLGQTFAGVLLSTTLKSWSPSQVKAEFARTPSGDVNCNYRRRDHSLATCAVNIIAAGAILDFGEVGSKWLRVFPKSDYPPDLLDRLNPTESLFLRRLSSKTLWFHIQDFDYRQGGGGTDETYEPLIRLLYTRPIYYIGTEYRATPYNAAVRREMARKWPEWRELQNSVASAMEAHLGEFVNPFGGDFSIGRYDSVRAYPKRVAVLTDGVGSAGEQFLLDARQSRKVTLFGKLNSYGELDFSNLTYVPTPSGRFWLGFATSRSKRLPDDPVDEHGIAPDIRVPSDVVDEIGYVQAWLEGRLQR